MTGHWTHRRMRTDWSDVTTRQGTPAATRSWKRQEGPSLRATRGSTALPPSWFQHSTTNVEIRFARTVREQISIVFQSLGLWEFVTAAIGKQYKKKILSANMSHATPEIFML